MSTARFHRLEDADLNLRFQVEETFRPKFSNDEWEALGTPRELLDALARRGLLKGDRPAPQRSALEREVRAALSEALGRDSADVANNVSMRELFGSNAEGLDHVRRRLELEPSLSVRAWLRRAATILLSAVFLVLLGERVRRGVAADEIPLWVALFAAALTGLACLWLVSRLFAKRRIHWCDIESLVELRLLCELYELRPEKGNLSRAQAFAWLQARVFFIVEGDDERRAPAQSLDEDQAFLEVFSE